MAQTRFLIGRGELLTSEIPAPRRGGETKEVYSLGTAQRRLAPALAYTAQSIAQLEPLACPAELAVAKLTLNPSYIAKSYFPRAFLRTVGLESVGSRRVTVVPERWTRKALPAETATTQMFVAGKRGAFLALPDAIERLTEGTAEAEQFARIEAFAPLTAEDRLRGPGPAPNNCYEFALHLLESEAAEIQRGFLRYAREIGAEVVTDLALTSGSLWFVPVRASEPQVRQLARFAFVRVLRAMPALRGFRPITRGPAYAIPCTLPSAPALSSEPRVAILDGGLPGDAPIAPWVGRYVRSNEHAPDDADMLGHGLAVTSAFLFGPIDPRAPAPRPFAPVDHHRVIDQSSNEEDPFELYRTLGHIEEILLSRRYEFLNLSLGPDMPVDDDDVHAWTSVIDEQLQDGQTFLTVAVGNNGERDQQLGFARVQVPSDCVNAMSVGAACSPGDGWARAPYSAVGPGRRPGVVKPDLVAFGGSTASYFHTLSPGPIPTVAPQLGTSFAAPFLLRSAVGIRAVLGQDVTPLAVKALLVHAAQQAGHDPREVGWGRVTGDVMEMVTCAPGVARIIYQGELKPGKYLRAQVPIPSGGLTGMVRLAATFCYACPTDPQDACSYTQAGLDIAFRPNSAKRGQIAQNAKTRSFFRMDRYANEEHRRIDHGKWETVLHDEANLRGSGLFEPAFDIHYNAREAGASAGRAGKIRYALVITIEASRHPQVYDEILAAYPNILLPVEPQVPVPVRT